MITFVDRPPLRSVAGHRHRASWKASPLAKEKGGGYRISGLEQGAVTQHGMHDDGKAAGERHRGFLEAMPLCDIPGQILSAKVC